MVYSDHVFTLNTVCLHHVSNVNTQLVHTIHSFWTHMFIRAVCSHTNKFYRIRVLSGTQGLFKTFVLPELTNYPCVYTRTRNLSWHVNTFNIQCHAHQVCYLNPHFIHIMCSTWTHSLTILCDHIVRICHMFKLNTQVIPIVQVTLST